MIQLLSELRNIELEIGELYSRFAELFAADRAFWTQLAGEEQQHADAVLREIERRFWGDTQTSEADRSLLAALIAERTRIEALVAQAEAGGIDSRALALQLALELEQGVAETHGHQVDRAGARAHLASLMVQMREHDEGHAERLRQYQSSVDDER